MAASRTVRASGPGTEKEESPPPVWPRLLIRPRVGLRPTTPQNAAGTRMDPPPSVPTCSGPSSAAVAAAAPPGTSVVKAFSRGSTAAMRASTASNSSAGETSRRCMRAAASASDRRTSAGSTTRVLYHARRAETRRVKPLAPAGCAGQYGGVAERGFILTPTYRVVGGRPEVHLYGVLEGGEPALSVDDRPA